MGPQVSLDSQRVQTRTVAIVGLEGSGKSEIAFRMVSSDASAQYVPIPTPGIAYSEVPMGGSVFRIHDCGGISRYREQWTYYIQQSDAATFVIDRNDKDRMGRVREEIADVITQCESQQIPLLILVNKSDLKNNLTLKDFTTITRINESKVDYAIKECCATTGDGVIGARDWLIQRIQANTRSLRIPAA
jgi:small GTP-binding protein